MYLYAMSQTTGGQRDSNDGELSTIPTVDPKPLRMSPTDEWFPTEILQQARDIIMSDGLDAVNVESEDFGVSKSMLRATLWNARTGDSLTDVYAPAGETDVSEIEVDKSLALGGNDGPRLAADAGRGFINLQMGAKMGENPEVLGIHVRAEECGTTHAADSRPPSCECKDGDALPCDPCFLEGFNRPASAE